MGRNKSRYKNLPPRMTARSSASGLRYFYNTRTGGKIPLGRDLNEAKRKWAEYESGSAGFSPETFGAVAERFKVEIIPTKSAKTQKEYTRQIETLKSVFGNVPIDAISPADIRKYIDARSAPVAANRETALFSTIFNHAREWGYTEKQNPISGVRKNSEPPRDVYIGDADFLAVRNAGDKILRDCMDLALLTGQRPADVLKMTRRDIVEDCLEVRQNKTDKRLRIRLEGELADLVERLTSARPGEVGSFYLIHTSDGKKVSSNMIRNRFDAARLAAGVSFQFRDIRAKTASDSESLLDAQSLLGHKSATTTARLYRRGEKVKPLK